MSAGEVGSQHSTLQCAFGAAQGRAVAHLRNGRAALAGSANTTATSRTAIVI